MTKDTASKSWYKKWWGIILIIFFLPFVILYLIWTKTNWNKWVKIGITAIFIIIIINGTVDSNKRQQEGLDLVIKAESFISENNIADALIVLDESQKLNTSKINNPAFELEEKIIQLQSDDFLKQTLVNMSDNNFELLKKGELKKLFIIHNKLNKLFTEKLQVNADQRDVYIVEIEELKKKEQEEAEKKRIAEEPTREEIIERQFSPWDGSHRKLTRFIKNIMNDPDSYKHVETGYFDMDDHLIVNTEFRGKNVFGGTVITFIKAKISIDGNDIEILEQY